MAISSNWEHINIQLKNLDLSLQVIIMIDTTSVAFLCCKQSKLFQEIIFALPVLVHP